MDQTPSWSFPISRLSALHHAVISHGRLSIHSSIQTCIFCYCFVAAKVGCSNRNVGMALQVMMSWHGNIFRCFLYCQPKRTSLAPVPLSIFRSNSKFDENSERSSFKYIRPITTIFCTRHDSVTVVTCAKYRCDRSSIFETRVFWIFIEFRIRSKYA